MSERSSLGRGRATGIEEGSRTVTESAARGEERTGPRSAGWYRTRG